MTQEDLSKMVEEFPELLPAGETGAIIFGSQHLNPEVEKMMELENMVRLYIPCPFNNEVFNKKSN